MVSIRLYFSRQMIVKVLRTNEDAIFRQPTAAETTLFASMIHKNSNHGWSETHPVNDLEMKGSKIISTIGGLMKTM